MKRVASALLAFASIGCLPGVFLAETPGGSVDSFCPNSNGGVAGNVVIGNSGDAARFAGCKSVDGDLTLTTAVDPATFAALEEVSGVIRIEGTNDLDAVVLPALASVGALIVSGTAPALREVSLPALATASSLQIIADADALASISLPALTSLTNDGPQVCPFSSGACAGWLIVDGGAALSALSAPVLASAAGVALSLAGDNVMTSLSFPALAGGAASAAAAAAPAVLVSATGFGNDQGSGRFLEHHMGSTAVDLPGDTGGRGPPTALTTVSLPAMRFGSLGLFGLSALTTVDVPNFDGGDPNANQDIGYVVMSSLPALRTLKVPLLSTPSTNPALSLRDLPVLETLELVNGAVTRSGIDLRFVGEGDPGDCDPGQGGCPTPTPTLTSLTLPLIDRMEQVHLERIGISTLILEGPGARGPSVLVGTLTLRQLPHLVSVGVDGAFGVEDQIQLREAIVFDDLPVLARSDLGPRVVASGQAGLHSLLVRGLGPIDGCFARSWAQQMCTSGNIAGDRILNADIQVDVTCEGGTLVIGGAADQVPTCVAAFGAAGECNPGFGTQPSCPGLCAGTLGCLTPCSASGAAVAGTVCASIVGGQGATCAEIPTGAAPPLGSPVCVFDLLLATDVCSIDVSNPGAIEQVRLCPAGSPCNGGTCAGGGGGGGGGGGTCGNDLLDPGESCDPGTRSDPGCTACQVVGNQICTRGAAGHLACTFAEREPNERGSSTLSHVGFGATIPHTITGLDEDCHTFIAPPQGATVTVGGDCASAGVVLSLTLHPEAAGPDLGGQTVTGCPTVSVGTGGRMTACVRPPTNIGVTLNLTTTIGGP